MPVRGIVRAATVKGAVTNANAPVYVDSDDNRLKVIPAGTGSTEVTVLDSSFGIGASGVVSTAAGVKIAAGRGVLVTGTLLVASGLASITSVAVCNVGNATGAPDNWLSYVVGTATGTTGTGATGDFTVIGWNWGTGAVPVADSTGTGSFAWIAFGA